MVVSEPDPLAFLSLTATYGRHAKGMVGGHQEKPSERPPN